MKHNRWTRIACLLLVLCLSMTLLPVAVTAAQGDSDETIDFVLVMDCSQTMSQNDPDDLVEEACQMFVDLIPVEDARVAIIAFGYEGDPYQYTHFDVKWDNSLVHVVAKLEGQLDTTKKNDIKAAVEDVGDENGLKTPIGAALAAGVDVLKNNNATPGNACLILMTDGEATSNLIKENDTLVAAAPAEAKKNQWPVYCIELDYWDKNEGKNDPERALLNQIVTTSGAGEDGRMKVSSPAEVAEAFLKIFAKFWGGDSDEVDSFTINSDGYAERQFEIPPLTSEATITISSTKLDYVELYNLDQDTKKTFSDDYETENMIVTVEDSYMCIKMVCPAAGNWMVRAYGDPDAEIVWYKGIQNEMNLEMKAVASSSAEILTKNDTITVNAFFTYNDIEVHNDATYEKTKAQLVVQCENGAPAQFEMNATKDGYSYELPVSAVPASGKFSIYVLVEHSMFRSGRTASNRKSFESQNLFAELIAPDVAVERSGSVNSTFETINLQELIRNPDGDALNYQLVCESNRNLEFVHTIENDYLNIETGMVPGTHELVLEISESGMSEPLRQKIILTVENQPAQIQPIAEQELWVDYMNFLFIKQNPTNLELHLDLSAYCSDPEKYTLTYGDVTCNQDGFVRAELEGSILHLYPEEKGDVEISFSVYDGVETVFGSFKVDVVSGIAIYWKTYGIVWAIVLAAIVITVIVVLSILKNKRVKGIWDVVLTENMMELPAVQDVDLSSHIGCANRHKVYLHEVVAGVANMITECDHLVPKYFQGNGAEQIYLDGVYFGKGGVLKGLPQNPGDQLRVMVNNGSVTANTKVNRGDIYVEIMDGTDQLIIQLTLR